MIQAVLFDMDGLLIDTEQWFVYNWPRAAQHFGYAMTREQALQLRSLAGEYAGPYLKGLFGEDFDYDAVRAYRRALMEQTLAEQGIHPKPGAKELLDDLKARGIRRAIVTATDEERARRYLTRVGLLDDFDEIVCATMVPHGKPAPDIYLHACAQLGEHPADCLALEDSPNGIKSAAAAGCRVVMVPDQTPPDGEVLPLLDGVARTLSDVIAIVQREETAMRRKDREVRKLTAIEEIIRRCRVCRVAYQDAHGLTIVPLSFGYAMNEGQLTLYFHSAKEGRKVDAFTRGADVAFEMDGAMEIVEGSVACEYGCTYESIVGNGRAGVVTDEAEKCRALSLIMRQQTGREFAFAREQAQSVAVLRIEASSFTGKRRGKMGAHT